jgi:hypothetical protein
MIIVRRYVYHPEDGGITPYSRIHVPGHPHSVPYNTGWMSNCLASGLANAFSAFHFSFIA